MKYPIAETFYSLQGEGYWAGTPAFFVRLAGCSVGCAWCDTDYKKKDEMDETQLVKLASKEPARRVIVTGGEPTDHNLAPLLAAFQEAGFRVHLETSGVRKVEESFDWITVSPKMNELDLKQRKGDECKVVFAWPKTWLPAFLELPFNHFFLQPLEQNGDTNATAVVEYVKQHPRWRLSLQTHKVLKIR